MDLSISRSGISVTPFNVVSSTLPMLSPSPTLFHLYPSIQQLICVWTLFSLWVGLSHPPLFCAVSETAANFANVYMADHHLPTPEYGPTLGNYSTVISPPTSVGRLLTTDVYMDDLNCLAQGSPAQQR